MTVRRRSTCLVFFALVLSAARSADAASFEICNTGQAVGCVGTLGDAAVDPNYMLIAPGLLPGSAKTVIDDGFPIPPWTANDADSRWITPIGADDDGVGPGGGYIYRTTFDLTGYAPATASITGLWSTDDAGLTIVINGVATSNTAPWAALVPFTISSGFISGLNMLDFYVDNSGGPTGLRVDSISGTADVLPEPSEVPEPATLVLLGTGLAALRARRVRKRVL